MLKAFRVLILVSMMLVIFTGTASAYEEKKVDVLVTINNNFQKTYKTSAITVGEFIEETGIEITEDHVVYPADNVTIRPGVDVTINEMVPMTLNVDGNPVTDNFVHTTVQKLVEEYSQTTGIEYAYDTSLDYASIKELGFIELKSKTSKTFENTEVIPNETEIVETEELEEGIEEVVVEGQNGERKIIVEIDYEAGEEVSRTTVSDEVVQEPINKIVHIGTGKVVAVSATEKIPYKEEFVMNASAYTSNAICTGKSPGDPGFGITASGMKARVGVVAVDPRVIPLGTNLYVEGYGYAIAGDTGGAIKGNKIDLYYNSYEECLRFGRRDIKVYVLD